MSVVLIAPPMVRAVEPLLGLAVLKAYLEAHAIPCACIDASAEAQEWLLQVDRLDPAIERLSQAPQTSDALRKRCAAWRSLRRRLEHHKRELRTWQAYRNFSRYRTAVTSLNRIIGLAGAAHDVEQGSPIQISLSNYEDLRFCDMDAASVAEAAADPARNLFYDYYRQELIPRLQALDPMVVGISCIFRSQLLGSVVLAQMVREALPNVHVVLGGELVSAWVSGLERGPMLDLADAILPYEGERGLLALARAVRANPAAPDLDAVPNLIWRTHDGRVRSNPTQKVDSLGEVPTPDFSWAPWELYFAPVRSAPMVAARGCYWNRCTFCPEVVNPETSLRIAPAAQLTRDMDAVHARWGVTHFHFIDSAIPPRTMTAIAKHVVDARRPYTWYGFSRLEPTLAKPGVAELLARGGCRMLSLGLETGSQRLLDGMDKHQQLDGVSYLLRRLEAAGVMVHAFLMFGTPREQREDAELTREFVGSHASSIQFLNCALMNLAIGSPMELEPAAHGIRKVVPFVIEGRTLDLALFANFEGEGWGRLEARRYLEQAFLRDPRVRPSVLRTPAHFDSNHSAYFHDLLFPRSAQLALAEDAAGRLLGS